MQVQNVDVPNTNGQKQTVLLAWRILWCTDEPLQSVFFKSWAQILSWNFKLGLRIKCQLDLFPSLQKSPMHGTLGQGGGYKCRLQIFPPAQILCLGWNHYKQYDSLFGNQRLLLVLLNWYDLSCEYADVVDCYEEGAEPATTVGMIPISIFH